MKLSGYVLAAVILAGALGARSWVESRASGRARRVLAGRESFENFPDSVGGWMVNRRALTGRQLELLDVDDYLRADFLSPSGSEEISVYVGYYIDPADATRHPPTICYPGAGWTKVYEGSKAFDVAGLEGGLEVNETLFERGSVKQLVVHWYSMPGYTGADASWEKVARLKGLLTGSGLVGASKIQIAMNVSSTREEAGKRLEKFLARLLPALEPFITSREPDRS